MPRRLGIQLLAVLGFWPPAGAQEPPPDEVRAVATRPGQAPRLTVSGHLDTRLVWRDAAVEETRAIVNRTPGPSDSVVFHSGSASIRIDAEFADRVRATVELERLPYDGGENLTLGHDAVTPVLDQAFVELGGFLSDRLTLQLGQFDFDYRLRPHGEPFFFDGDAEPFYSGAGATFARVTADRDLSASAGARLRWDPVEIALVELAVVWRDTDAPASASDSEIAALLYANALAGERTSLFLLAALVAGPGHGAEVWTAGAGLNQYFGPRRDVELFAEAYAQFGALSDRVDKGAWGGQLGVRYVHSSGFWAEAAGVYRSGDRRPTDDRDGTFQSAERVDGFLIVESAEFGLDWDTNVRSLQLQAGHPLSRRATARVDAGWFAFNEDLVDDAGALLLDKGDNGIGFEVDGTIAWELNAQARVVVRGGALLSSEVMRELHGDENTWVASVGAETKF